MQSWCTSPPDMLKQLAREQVSGEGHISRNGALEYLMNAPMLQMATKRPVWEPFGHSRNVSSETADTFRKRRDLEPSNIGWNQFCFGLGMLCGLNDSLYLSEFAWQFPHI